MNKTNASSECSAAEMLEMIQTSRASLTPALRRVANYLLDNPNEIGVSSIRELAAKANVNSNSVVRLAHALGVESYDAFREIFREEIRQGKESFPDRARWLQSLSCGGRLGGLYAEIVRASVGNLEALYSKIDYDDVRKAARIIVNARNRYVLGVGVAQPVASNFAYLAGMAFGNVNSLPRGGTLPVDGLVRACKLDVLIAMTFKPYRSEVVEAVELARSQLVSVIAVSDSLACPIMADAEHRIVVETETPQFFTSTIALTAFFELLLALAIAESGCETIENIEAIHRQRYKFGVYVAE